MKASKYNLYLEEGGNYYIYNQLTSAFTQVDQELYTSLKENNLESINRHSFSDIEEELHKSHFICDNDLVEENIILRMNREFRYGRHMARVTVLPTVNCNFRCWYCYETHTESQMSEQDMKAILIFMENLIKDNKLNVFQLDWFGGEPLLLFNEIIYPTGLKMKKLCKTHNVHFSHTITTNGYLINDEMINKMNKIGLNSFQITLDGSSTFHNKTRFSKTDKQTYDTIVNNITSLCRKINNINITLRINYTPKNLSTIDTIAHSFPEDVRAKIHIQPQLVWQFKYDINGINDTIKEKLRVFSSNGFPITTAITPSFNHGCYVENSLQYVINYDLSVYKCTARDFVSKKFSIGNISNDGDFKPNSNYYNYFTSSYMENPTCLACSLLPICSGMCIQKKIENGIGSCPKENVEKSLINQLYLLIESSRKDIES